MKIAKIKIRDYKAFYGTKEINVEGKNLFIYGENGSGKSSLYYALKDFFQSSIEEFNYDETENIFIEEAEKGKGYIKVFFNPDKDGNTTPTGQEYSVTKTTKNTYSTGDTSIRDAIKLKSFLTYKHLLDIHHIKKNDEIDLFDLLVKGVLKHFKSVAITGNKELGELWTDFEKAVAKPLEGTAYNITKKKADVDGTLQTFNSAFSKLFQPGSPEYILTYAQPILDKFGHNIEVELRYTNTKVNDEYNAFERNHVRLKIKYLGKEISKAHIFLNEARLSAIAISIYLGMVKRHIQGVPCKLLFLDDIFIGLDISNRLPLLEILDTDFSAYQVFITTYDKPWYEFMKSTYLHNNSKWKSYEFYARRSAMGFEIPIIHEINNESHIKHYIDKADTYFNDGDNKAAGVYLRSAFEFILKQFCHKNVPVQFYPDVSKMTANIFWEAIKDFKIRNIGTCNLTPATEAEIDSLLRLVLNPLNHHTINKHEISGEIQRALTAIKKLKSELRR
jgi:hypothetical protein